METYLRVVVSSEGASPSELYERLRSIGFEATQGNYDFVYEWKSAPSRDELIELTDEVSRRLAGCRVWFEIETV